MINISIPNISNTTNNSSTVSANIDGIESSNEVIQHGFVWATHDNPTVNDNKNELGAKSNVGDCNYSLGGLSYATVYYVKCYAKDNNGVIHYSPLKFFATKTQADEYGFVWATHTNPTVNDHKVINNIKTNQTGLGFLNDLGTMFIGTMYIKAYCKNKFGVSYGNELNITFTSKGEIANNSRIKSSGFNEVILKTLNASNITTDNATLKGNIKGSLEIKECGFIITDKNTSSNNVIKTDISESGDLNYTINSLSYATTYFYKTYAKDKHGTVYYGQEKFFTTQTQILEYGFVWATHSNPTLSDNKIVNLLEGRDIAQYVNNLGTMFIGTMYIRSYMTNKFGVSYGNQLSITFTTKGAIANSSRVTTNPSKEIILKTLDTNNITTHKATLRGNIKGSLEIKECGFVRSINRNPDYNNAIKTSMTPSGNLNCDFDSLSYATTYFYRVFIKDKYGDIHYGQEKFFTTQTQTIECGFVWATHVNPTIKDNKIKDTSKGRNIGQFIDDLGTMFIGTMYIRSYMMNKFGVSYGNQRSITFTTKGTIANSKFIQLDCADKLIFNINKPVTNINDATVKGVIKTSKNNIKEYGFIWGSNDKLSYSKGKVVNLGGVISSKEFTYNIKGLSYATMYYYRMYMKDSKDIVYYSREEFFTTKTLMENYGFVWGTAHNPTVGDNIVQNGEIRSTTGMSNSLPVLRNGANYVKTFVKNKFGIAYGNELSIYVSATGEIAKLNITTNNSKPFVINTKYATNITPTRATLSASVVKNNLNIKKYGFVWATHDNPTLSDSKKEFDNSLSNKSFSYEITGLIPTTTYYFKPYIIDTKDNVYYGNEKFLETKLGASEYGFVCSTSNNPTVNDIKVCIGATGNTGELSSQIDGLKPQTTYYIKAYAIIADNIIYGNELIFVTDKKGFNLKCKTDTSIKNITSIYYKKNGVWNKGMSLYAKVGEDWKIAEQ